MLLYEGLILQTNKKTCTISSSDCGKVHILAFLSTKYFGEQLLGNITHNSEV